MSRAERDCDSLACMWMAIYLQEAVIGGGGEVNMGGGNGLLSLEWLLM